MIHQTTVTRVRTFWGRTLYRVACTCAQLHTETDSKALAESVARGHERTAW